MSVPRIGVVAVGSNSVRMLTANLDAALSQPVRGRVETALFLSMDEKKRFSEEAMERVAQAVASLCRQARAAGAQQLRMIGTSAMRDAVNRNELDFYIAATSPALLNRIISGEEEAQLSFLGATCVPPRPGVLGMIDIGGGSTEVATGTADEGLRFSRSLQLGASRLLMQQRIDTPRDLAAARHMVRAMLKSNLPALPEPAQEWTLVGGTGTTLAGMVEGLTYHDTLPEGIVLTLETVSEWLTRLADMTASQRSALPGMPPTRVHILPTGLAILEGVMEHVSIPQLRVSQRNNLDGYLYRLYKNPEEDGDG